MMLRRSMAYLLPLAPFGIAIVGIDGAAPYCGAGLPCEPQPPFVRPITMDFKFVGADPLHPMVRTKARNLCHVQSILFGCG